MQLIHFSGVIIKVVNVRITVKNMKMKRISIVLTLLFMVFSVYTFGETEERKTGPFSKVALSISADLHVKQAGQYSLKLVGDASSLEKIVTEVKSGKLIIRTEKSGKWWDWFRSKENRIGEVEIFVTLPEIEALSVAGSGNIVAEELIESPEMELNIAGSGDMKIAKLIAGEVEVNIAGSGDIQLKEGEVKGEIEVDIAGSGDFSSGNVKVEEADIEIAGSGTCYLGDVQKLLNVQIAGSGDVYYSGNPEKVDSRIAGSGSVRKK